MLACYPIKFYKCSIEVIVILYFSTGRDNSDCSLIYTDHACLQKMGTPSATNPIIHEESSFTRDSDSSSGKHQAITLVSATYHSRHSKIIKGGNNHSNSFTDFNGKLKQQSFNSLLNPMTRHRKQSHSYSCVSQYHSSLETYV